MPMLADRWDFKTSSYASEQQASAWSEVLARLSFALTDPRAGQAVEASAHSQISPDGVVCAKVSAAPQELVSVARDDVGAVWLVLLLEGRGMLIRPGDALTLAPGDIAIGHVATQARIALESHFRALFVKFPGAVLARRMVLRPTAYLGILPGSAEIGPVMAALLNSIAQTLEKLSPEMMRLLEGTLAEFLVAALANASSTLTSASANQTLMLQRICQDIETRLSDPDLTLPGIAEEHGLSPRYLQKLFEAAGDNFGHFLRRRRLERARADMLNPIYAQLSISEIGFRWGFNDAAHFSRAFRQHFGATPRALRATVPNQPVVAATSAAIRGWPDGFQRALRRGKTGGELRERAFEWQNVVKARRANLKVVSRSDGDAESRTQPSHHYLAASDQTVHWGFLNKALAPVLETKSGDFVTIETLTQHACDDFERMIEGDAGAESVFLWTKDRKAIERRGAGPMDASVYGRGAGEGFGVHICTGPIAIADAEPGDIVELRIVDIALRPSANPQFDGKAYGSNAAAWWGFHYDDFLGEPRPREVVTIYEISEEGGTVCAKPLYNYRWTPQRDPFGVVHATMDYPGVPIDTATIEKNWSVMPDVRVPARLHFGFVALAPKEAGHVDSIPPAYFGGNLDNWRLGKNAKIFLPVSVPGGLLSIGDPHAAQGDGQVSGTAIEASLTGVFQIVLHKKAARSNPMLADLDYPVIETSTEWIVHGFSHPNYLAEFGEDGQSEIYRKASLKAAMRDAYRKMRRFIMATKRLSEDEAISLISVGVDFCVTQVVDGNLGVHAILRKDLFVDAGQS
jgi:acetamidase/formamidase/AraC-like DNA-binding protein